MTASSEGVFNKAVLAIALDLKKARGGREAAREKGPPSMLTPGDVSSLARMDLGVPAAAFWRLMAEHVPAEMRQGAAERGWALALKGMALMAPHHQVDGQHPGLALAKAGFSPDERFFRVNRLLKAEGEAFEDLFLRACSFLASKAEPVDWRDFTRLAVYADDAARNDFARAFFGAN